MQEASRGIKAAMSSFSGCGFDFGPFKRIADANLFINQAEFDNLNRLDLIHNVNLLAPGHLSTHFGAANFRYGYMRLYSRQ